MRARDYSELIIESLLDQIAKADRIITNQLVLVKGLDCHKCSADCPYKKESVQSAKGWVTLNDEDFSQDIDVYLKNLYQCIKTTVAYAVREIRHGSGSGEI